MLNQGSFLTERRAMYAERRGNRRKAAVHSFYRNRRKEFRRTNDLTTGVYVDSHEPRLWYLAISLMVMSVLDAFFTTILISNGSEELNPILAYFLEIDLWVFLAVKFLITGSSIVFFILHKHHLLLNTISCRRLLEVMVVIYVVLVSYELLMLRHLVSL